MGHVQRFKTFEEAEKFNSSHYVRQVVKKNHYLRLKPLQKTKKMVAGLEVN
ncbi:MAG: hypothetical protein Q7S68_04880 [Deltaproteobacteria bacterium]|nr:hypothetical protein [Deltaproteobacteria bacterium]